MLGSLRSKLIASYVVIIFLALFLAGSAFMLLLRDYQQQLALKRLADLAVPVSLQVRALERSGVGASQIAGLLQEHAAGMGVRILLVDAQSRVVEDTQGSLTGQQIPPPARDFSAGRGRLSAYWDAYRDPDSRLLFLVALRPRGGVPLSEGPLGRGTSYSVVLAAPERSVTAAWLELLPSLSLAALASFLVSIIVAVILSRSISRPVAQMTRASEEMARGNYDQFIAAKGKDEVARLAVAFNTMAQAVGLSQRTLRGFLANVSHELRTPLTSIQGFSQAMVEGAVRTPEDYAAAGRIINEEAGRMRRLVEELLYLSKIEAGQIPLERRDLDMGELLRACTRRIQPPAQRAGIKLELEVTSLPPVRGDEGLLEQVFGNLLDNALKHTPPGGAIRVRAQAGDPLAADLPAWVVVSVHNTGSFIPAEDLPRVFERFYQLDKARAKNAGGSGLGLAIVKELVQAHGGTVEARSDLATGTEFIVRLPTDAASFSSFAVAV